MLAPVLLLLLACSLGSPQGREQKRKPAPIAERVAETTAALDKALDAGDAPGLVAALDSAQSVPHADVVRCVVRALED